MGGSKLLPLFFWVQVTPLLIPGQLFWSACCGRRGTIYNFALSIFPWAALSLPLSLLPQPHPTSSWNLGSPNMTTWGFGVLVNPYNHVVARDNPALNGLGSGYVRYHLTPLGIPLQLWSVDVLKPTPKDWKWIGLVVGRFPWGSSPYLLICRAHCVFHLYSSASREGVGWGMIGLRSILWWIVKWTICFKEIGLALKNQASLLYSGY